MARRSKRRRPCTDQHRTASPASTSTCPPTTTEGFSKNTSPTLSCRNVFLTDWWLVACNDPDGKKRLAVGGMMRTGLYVSRVFTSAAIAKRIDAYTLKTIDGITVVILGIINKGHTKGNGFTSKACAYFEIGFPCNWDEYANDYFAKETPCRNCKQSVSEFANSASLALEDRDLKNYNIFGIFKKRLYDAFKKKNITNIMQATSSHMSETDRSQLHSDNTEHNLDGDETRRPIKDQLGDDLAGLTPKEAHVSLRSAWLQKLETNPKAHTDFLLGKSCSKGTENTSEGMHYNKLIEENMQIRDMNEAAMNMQQETLSTGRKVHKHKNKTILMEDQNVGVVRKCEANLTAVKIPLDEFDAPKTDCIHDIENTCTFKIELDGKLDTRSSVHVPRRSARLKKLEESTQSTSEVKIESYSKSSVNARGCIERTRKISEKRVKKCYSPVMQDVKKGITRSLASPEMLELKRSRSGRVLVPRLDVSQNIAYDMNGAIVGVITTSYGGQTDLLPSNPRNGNPRKRKNCLLK